MFKHFDKLILGIDVGGSHISSALVKSSDGQIMEESFCRQRINSQANCFQTILDGWLSCISVSLGKLDGYVLEGIGIAMPGPFDYQNGISQIKGVNKYEALFGINIAEALRSRLGLEEEIPIYFENDAACFGFGACSNGIASGFKRVVAITLGTGLGSCFVAENQLLKSADGVPQDGCLYNIPFKDGVAEDYISSRWLVETYAAITGKRISDVKEIAQKASINKEPEAIKLFLMLADNMAELLSPWLLSFKADCLVIGGSIAQSSSLFLPTLIQLLQEKSNITIPLKISDKMELSAIAGAAGLLKIMEADRTPEIPWRKSLQELMPMKARKPAIPGEYDLYPFSTLGDGKIFSGYETMAQWMTEYNAIMIDGYAGNDWSAIRRNLTKLFKKKQLNVLWYETSAFLKSENEIEELVRPYLGEPDSVWGKKTTLHLEDLYDIQAIKELRSDIGSYELVVLIGVGAGLSNWEWPLIYVDLPKNEIQYRMRAGSVTNIGTSKIADNASMYKRSYFVDWVLLNEYRKAINNKILVVADGQWKENITWAFKDSIIEGLQSLSHSIIRARPWFEAGAWGGQWLKKHISSLNKNEINYAWSFELIVPENGLVFESDGNLLEISFAWLMEHNSKEILGKDSDRFGEEFPIRFDFLDTFDGGNLSIQCHPSLTYIQENFGENITQDETYYILDCKDEAAVYLGFCEDIKADQFRKVLEESLENNKPLDVKKYVQKHKSHKHDLFLIPNQTIHSAGINNIVLEISATPYIFTFKMYDWLRLDLEGKPRPINIVHAFNNLNFERKGEKVKQELISRPSILEKNDQYTLIHLPTHKEHFYDVHRIEFLKEAEIKTEDKCHVLMLVEGANITVETLNGSLQEFNYAETFIIPASAGTYKLINKSGYAVKVIKAFIK
ncbi:MAG: ROK family protein [Bacteroidota bacterium]|nr:ROK family protein [Bacteroidota bacterium]